MKKYVLDLGEVEKLPPYYLGHRLIPCVPGEHEAEYDVIGEELPVDVLESFRKQCTKKQKNRPIGFDWSNCPVGAVLRRIA